MDEIVELMAQIIAPWAWERSNPPYKRQARAKARAALSALHDAGYSVVPNDPTDEMLRQGAMTFYENRHLTTYASRIPYIYRAMLAASPVKRG